MGPCNQVMARTTANSNWGQHKRLACTHPTHPCPCSWEASSLLSSPCWIPEQDSLSPSMSVNYRCRLKSLFLLGCCLWWGCQTFAELYCRSWGCVSSHSCISLKSFNVPLEGYKSSNMQSQVINVKIKQELLGWGTREAFWGSGQ